MSAFVMFELDAASIDQVVGGIGDVSFDETAGEPSPTVDGTSTSTKPHTTPLESADVYFLVPGSSTGIASWYMVNGIRSSR
ncbi:MAG: hypothetical protein U0235_22790 [Polyangiaceae bacterium]